MNKSAIQRTAAAIGVSTGKSKKASLPKLPHAESFAKRLAANIGKKK